MTTPEENSFKEKRKHPRKSCLIAVECGIKNSIFVNYIHNISYDGVFIETSEPFEVGQTISLKILAPYDLKKINHIAGKIVRVESKGIAINFSSDDPVQKTMIKEFVEKI